MPWIPWENSASRDDKALGEWQPKIRTRYSESDDPPHRIIVIL
jgi:hypothetical protein